MSQAKGLYRIASQENLEKYQALLRPKQSGSQKRLPQSEEGKSVESVSRNVLEKFYLYK